MIKRHFLDLLKLNGSLPSLVYIKGTAVKSIPVPKHLSLHALLLVLFAIVGVWRQVGYWSLAAVSVDDLRNSVLLPRWLQHALLLKYFLTGVNLSLLKLALLNSFVGRLGLKIALRHFEGLIIVLWRVPLGNIPPRVLNHNSVLWLTHVFLKQLWRWLSTNSIWLIASIETQILINTWLGFNDDVFILKICVLIWYARVIFQRNVLRSVNTWLWIKWDTGYFQGFLNHQRKTKNYIPTVFIKKYNEIINKI